MLLVYFELTRSWISVFFLPILGIFHIPKKRKITQTLLHCTESFFENHVLIKIYQSMKEKFKFLWWWCSRTVLVVLLFWYDYIVKMLSISVLTLYDLITKVRYFTKSRFAWLGMTSQRLIPAHQVTPSPCLRNCLCLFFEKFDCVTRIYFICSQHAMLTICIYSLLSPQNPIARICLDIKTIPNLQILPRRYGASGSDIPWSATASGNHHVVENCIRFTLMYLIY